MERSTGGTIWFWRLAYLPPILIAWQIIPFKDGVAQTIERTRMAAGLLPFPCLIFKHSIDIWYAVTGLCLALFVLSFRFHRLTSAPAVAIGYGRLSLLLALQLFWALVLISVFLR